MSHARVSGGENNGEPQGRKGAKSIMIAAKLFIQNICFSKSPRPNSPRPGSSNQFWKTFADIDTTDINGIDMGKNKESRRNAKKSRDAAS